MTGQELRAGSEIGESIKLHEAMGSTQRVISPSSLWWDVSDCKGGPVGRSGGEQARKQEECK
jgi:hypothetical protein